MNNFIKTLKESARRGKRITVPAILESPYNWYSQYSEHFRVSSEGLKGYDFKIEDLDNGLVLKVNYFWTNERSFVDPEEKIDFEALYELCKGRHEPLLQVDGALFEENILQPLNFEWYEEQLQKRLCYISHLRLIVTGLTPALTAVIKYCYENNKGLTLLHFDRESTSYVEQRMF